MKKLLLLPAFCLACCTALMAQEPAKPAREIRRDYSPGAASPTPEMWFYEQERSRYDDPKMAVRRKAEFRAAQRSNRIASQHWYGMSNSRPTVSTTPWFGTYSPTWSSNSADPYRWSATGQVGISFSPGKLY
jgi:hypothetical protein